MKKLLLAVFVFSSLEIYAGPGSGTVGGGGKGDTIVAKRLFISSDRDDSFFRAMKKEEIDSSGLLRAARQTGKIPNEIQFFMNEENDSEVEEIRVLTNFSDIESIKLKDGRVIYFSDRKLREKLEFYSR